MHPFTRLKVTTVANYSFERGLGRADMCRDGWWGLNMLRGGGGVWRGRKGGADMCRDGGQHIDPVHNMN